MVRVNCAENPQEVIPWQQTTAEDRHGLCCSSLPRGIGISTCALVAVAVTCIASRVFSQPLLLRPSVSDRAQMPDRIETERRNRMNESNRVDAKAKRDRRD
jgi:hypothetical protein